MPRQATNTVSVDRSRLELMLRKLQDVQAFAKASQAVGRNTSNVLFLMHLMRHAGNATCVRVTRNNGGKR